MAMKRRWIALAAVGPALVAAFWWRPAQGQQRETILHRPAPELVGEKWFNTPEGKPVTWASRRGKVTMVHFWTFG